MTEQRRLAAIVSADVAGYSRLMGGDESGTLAALKAVRQQVVDPAIAMHGGRIVKTSGDGLLLEFPSVVNAVRCSLEVQTAMVDRGLEIPEDRRITFRIGINIGDIIVEGDDIFGDGVNVAARLQEIAPPGGICISSRVHEDVRDRLAAAFKDGGTQTLKNIARPVQTWRWQPSMTVAPVLAPAPTALPLPDKPSIAVLPFQNMSGDPEQEYFVDGLVEDIITALSRFRSLFVIARNSSFSYKGKSPDIRQVGRELGVRYVLEGSVRKGAARLRITAQLVEAASGEHLWAERFDGPLRDVFELQDQVTSSVVGQLTSQVQLAEMERARRKPTGSLDAYDFYLRGLTELYKWNKPSNQAALDHFSKAVQLDADFALAHAYAGFAFVLRKQSRWMEDVPAESDEAVQLSRRALELGRDDPLALAVVGLNLAFIASELDVGDDCVSSALSANPNLAFGWGFGGLIKMWRGQHHEALEYIERALRLSPRDPQNVQLQTAVALSHFFVGQFDESARLAEKVVARAPNFHAAWRTLAIACALAGDRDQAKRAVQEFRKLDPTASIPQLLAVLPLRRQEDRDLYAQGLRRAEFPE